MLCAHCEKPMLSLQSCDPRALGRSLFSLQLALYPHHTIILFELRESRGMRIQPLLSQVRGPQGDKWDLTSCPATAMNSPRRCPLWFTEHSAVLTLMSSPSLRQAVWLSGTGSRALGSNPALVLCWPLRPELFCKHAVVMTAATQAAGLTLSVSS